MSFCGRGGPGCDVCRGSLLRLLLFFPLVGTRRLEEAGGTGALSHCLWLPPWSRELGIFHNSRPSPPTWWSHGDTLLPSSLGDLGPTPADKASGSVRSAKAPAPRSFSLSRGSRVAASNSSRSPCSCSHQSVAPAASLPGKRILAAASLGFPCPLRFHSCKLSSPRDPEK